MKNVSFANKKFGKTFSCMNGIQLLGQLYFFVVHTIASNNDWRPTLLNKEVMHLDSSCCAMFFKPTIPIQTHQIEIRQQHNFIDEQKKGSQDKHFHVFRRWK